MVLLVLLVLWFSSSCTIDEDRTEIRTSLNLLKYITAYLVLKTYTHTF